MLQKHIDAFKEAKEMIRLKVRLTFPDFTVKIVTQIPVTQSTKNIIRLQQHLPAPATVTLTESAP